MHHTTQSVAPTTTIITTLGNIAQSEVTLSDQVTEQLQTQATLNDLERFIEIVSPEIRCFLNGVAHDMHRFGESEDSINEVVDLDNKIQMLTAQSLYDAWINLQQRYEVTASFDIVDRVLHRALVDLHSSLSLMDLMDEIVYRLHVVQRVECDAGSLRSNPTLKHVAHLTRTLGQIGDWSILWVDLDSADDLV